MERSNVESVLILQTGARALEVGRGAQRPGQRLRGPGEDDGPGAREALRVADRGGEGRPRDRAVAGNGLVALGVEEHEPLVLGDGSVGESSIGKRVRQRKARISTPTPCGRGKNEQDDE